MIPIPTKNRIKPKPLGKNPSSAGEKKTNALTILGNPIAINAPIRIKRVLRFISFPHHQISYGSIAGFRSNANQGIEQTESK